MSAPLPDAVAAPPSRARRWLRALLPALIFVCGAITGGAGGALWMRNNVVQMIRHPERVTARVMPVLRYMLWLDPAQAARVEEIMNRRYRAMDQLRAESLPQIKAEFDGMRDEVAAMLEPGQRGRWQALCRRAEERFLPFALRVPPPGSEP